MSTVVEVIRIEGVGDSSGQWAFPSAPVRAYDPRYRAWMPVDSAPRIDGASVPPLGGCMMQGGLSFDLADIGGALTSAFALDTPPISALTSDVSSSGTSVTFRACPSAYFYVGGIIVLGDECVRLDALTSGTTWAVTRGWLGTTASTHDAGTTVWPQLRFIAGREVVYSLSVDGVETEHSRWWMDAPSMSEDLTTYALSCRSRDRVLDARVPRPLRARVKGTSARTLHTTGEWTARYGGRVYVRGDDSIMRCRVGGGGTLEVEATGLSGTPRLDADRSLEEALRDVSEVEEAFLCDPGEVYAAVRYSVTSANVDDWLVSSHPIPVILALLTSGHADGVANGSASLGWYASLPSGLGLAHSEIDHSSVHRAWSRTQRAEIPHWTLDPGMTVRDIVDAVARYTGIVVGWRRGKLTFEALGSSSPSETITLADLIAEDRGGLLIPSIGTPRYTDEHTVTRVVYTCSSASGEEVTSEYVRADFPQIFGAREGRFGDDFTRDIDAHWVRVDGVGLEPEYMRQRALSVLRTYGRLLWTVPVTTPLSWWLEGRLAPGDVVWWSHSVMPDFATGLRGTASDARWLVLDESPDVRAGTCTWTLLSQGYQAPVGGIAPSGRIISGGATVTIQSNRYTDPQNGEGWPVRDSAAFSIGDIVVVRDRAGSTLSATATVLAIGTDTLTLSSSLPSATSGRVVELADSASALQSMMQRSVYLASDSEVIGASGLPAWRLRGE